LSGVLFLISVSGKRDWVEKKAWFWVTFRQQ